MTPAMMETIPSICTGPSVSPRISTARIVVPHIVSPTAIGYAVASGKVLRIRSQVTKLAAYKLAPSVKNAAKRTGTLVENENCGRKYFRIASPETLRSV